MKNMELDSQRTVVVAVHLQGDVVTPQGAFGGFFAEMVDKTGVLARSADVISAARSGGATIAYTRIVFSPGHPELIVNNALFGVVDQAKCCVEGTAGATIVPDVAPREHDLVIDHHRVSGAHGSTLVAELRARNVDTAVIFGVATNISVEGTARDLVDEGFRTIVVADCCTAANEAAHDASIGTLTLVASEVSDATTVINALGSGVPA
jgi:nicotinamidase-related amidase